MKVGSSKKKNSPDVIIRRGPAFCALTQAHRLNLVSNLAPKVGSGKIHKGSMGEFRMHKEASSMTDLNIIHNKTEVLNMIG